MCVLVPVTAATMTNGDALQQAYSGVQQYAGIGAVQTFIISLYTGVTSSRSGSHVASSIAQHIFCDTHLDVVAAGCVSYKHGTMICCMFSTNCPPFYAN